MRMLNILSVPFLSTCICLCTGFSEVLYADRSTGHSENRLQVALSSHQQLAFERLKFEYIAAIDVVRGPLPSRIALQDLHTRLLDAREQLIAKFVAGATNESTGELTENEDSVSLLQSRAKLVEEAPIVLAHTVARDDEADATWITKSLAILWLAFVGLLPFYFIYTDWESTTRTQIATSMLLFTWLWFCVYMFTCCLHFKSYNIAGSRCLSVEEVVYVLAQILTTVGYGDITPTSSSGELWMASFILVGVIIVANVIDHVLTTALHHARDYTLRLQRQVRLHSEKSKPLGKSIVARVARVILQTELDAEDVFHRLIPMHKNLQPLLSAKVLALEYTQLLRALIAVAVMFLSGIIFWTLEPGEERPLTVAVYMTVVTFSTVGFGAHVAHSSRGYVFAAFWMLFGVASFVSLIAAVWELICQVRAWEEMHSKRKAVEFDELISKHGLMMDSHIAWEQFLMISLEFSQVATEQDIHYIRETFESFKHDSDDNVTVKAVREVQLVHLNSSSSTSAIL